MKINGVEIEPGANLWRANLSRANLSDADLRGANLSDTILSDAILSYANLRGADLWRANLRGANLRGANLRGADLRGANLSDAILSDANLSDAILWGCVGNGRELKSAQLSYYSISWTTDVMQIGCEQHPFEDWWEFKKDRIYTMDGSRATAFWDRWKEVIRQMVETS